MSLVAMIIIQIIIGINDRNKKGKICVYNFDIGRAIL